MLYSTSREFNPSRLVLGAALVFSTLVTLGCASGSLSEHQCTAGDWYTVGHRDGQNGLAQSALLTHQNACGKFDVVPDSAQYRSGWVAGIETFCQPQRGYDAGRAGNGYRAVCPDGLRAEHREAYDNGRQLFLALRDVQRLENQIASSEARIDAIGDDLISVATEQVNPDLTTADRLDLLAEVKRLMDERTRLTESLPALAADLDVALDHLARVEQTVAQR